MTLIAVVSATFIACEKVDNQAPTINLIAPEEDETFRPGSDIHFEAKLSDDVALKSYKINIHGAFDGHTHGRAAEDVVALNKTWTEEDFVKLGETSIAGKKQVTLHHHHLEIPAEINGKPIREGHYHFMIYCTDQAGNEAYVAREIVISSDAKEHDHH